MKPLAAFTWGYWGWGNAAPELVKAVDALERTRGFKPPLFADIRLSRSVRAPGFRDRAYEDLVGPARYVWMPKLGNQRFRTGGDPRALVAAASRRRRGLELQPRVT